MKYSKKTYTQALQALAALRENVSESEKATIDFVAEAIYEKADREEAEKNVPLTLDELRQMDGEPVWVVEYPDWGHWELSEDAEDYISDRDTDFYGMKCDDPLGKYGIHVMGWMAYRHKPKED